MWRVSERRGAEQRVTGNKAVSQLWDNPKDPLSLLGQWGAGVGWGGVLRNQEAGIRNPLEGREERSPFLQKMIPKHWEARQAGGADTAEFPIREGNERPMSACEDTWREADTGPFSAILPHT